MNDDVPIPREVEKQLRLMLRSEMFERKPTVSAMFEYIVIATLNGEPVTEKSIGIKALGKPADWNPAADHGIRENKRNLVRHLAEYNAASSDPVIIELSAGYTPRWAYNPNNRERANPPGSLGADFFTALDEHYAEAQHSGLRCVVTGEPADWYALDGKPLNRDFGNLLPLSAPIRFHLNEVRGGRAHTLPELAPAVLAEEMAPRHFREWQLARAYGCACLAFHLGAPPFGHDSGNQRLSRLCDALYYTRCRHNGHLFEYLIGNTVLRHLIPLDSLDPVIAHRLALELIPLLINSRHVDAARRWLDYSENELAKPFESLLQVTGRLSPFAFKQAVFGVDVIVELGLSA